jgi:hypothetical protein
MMLALGLSNVPFIMWRNSPSSPCFFIAFIMKEYWILSKNFSASIEKIMQFWGLASVYMLYYIYRFMYVEPSLHSWNEVNLIMVYDLFDVFLNSVCKYFVENLCIYIH